MDEPHFTVAQARGLLGEVVAHSKTVIDLRADLADLAHATRRGQQSDLGGIPEAKAAEAALEEHLSWFRDQGLQVKSVAPLLLDFPSDLDREPVLLCWLEGETTLDWYHPLSTGFMGRRRIP